MKVAVVGATGAVGQTTLKILEERKFPVSELRLFASERSVGKTMTFKGERLTLERLGAGSFKGIDLALFSAGSAQSKQFAPEAVRAGAVVVDKSSAFRMDPTVPLVVPEINGHAVKGHRGIVACPNCTTIVTVMPLAPLHEAGRLRRVIASSYQAVSGAGVQGVDALREETLAWARGEAITPRHFPHQIAFNVIPHVDKFGDNGYTAEELKLVNEVRKILELPDLPISPTTVRVPVFASFPGLKLWDEPGENRYPMPVTVEGQDECYVGRIREDLSLANGLNFWVTGDQLRKGAALNGIQIAELLIR
jgi:aspartate-semialdehyde dehydrogenase